MQAPVVDNTLYVASSQAAQNLSRCGLAVRRLAGEKKDLGSIRFDSPFSSIKKLWFMDTVL